MFLGMFSPPKVPESYHPKEESKRKERKSLILQLKRIKMMNECFFVCLCFFFADELDHLLLPLKNWLPRGGGEIPWISGRRWSLALRCVANLAGTWSNTADDGSLDAACLCRFLCVLNEVLVVKQGGKWMNTGCWVVRPFCFKGRKRQGIHYN